jgi:circadian clock protein KaiC
MEKPRTQLPKAPTGIEGLDEILGGGLPQGRPTLVCGNTGCGKTLLGIEFIVQGAVKYQEPGVFVAFEETDEDLAKNVASLGFDLPELTARGSIVVDHIHVDRSEFEESGEYNLEGLFIRLGLDIDSIGAKRVVLDTMENLFSGFSNQAVLRAEIRRLFTWLKDRGVTTVITGERGDDTLTRQGLEEYVSDCVIVLDHRVINQSSTRRLRVLKYRGTMHGTNEYPFLIDENGISVLPITAFGLHHSVNTTRISTGIPTLDQMLGGSGYYRGSSVLISGTAGSGKTSVAAHFVDAACRRGERALYFAFEESPEQVKRNMASIGLDLGQWERQGLLRFQANRPTAFGLEMHLALIHKAIAVFQPQVVIVDPLNSFISAGNEMDVKAMLMRLVDFLKEKQITSLMTNLTSGSSALESTDAAISSLIDTWLLLRDIEIGGERNRGMYILKSRGMAHSNQIREFLLTDHGIELLEVYTGQAGVLTGSARLAQEAKEQAEKHQRAQQVERLRLELERKRKALETQINALRTEFAAEEEDVLKQIGLRQELEEQMDSDRDMMMKSRKVD